MREFYFSRDDSLERIKYAEFLQNILINNGQFRRDDSDGAYVLAVDSPWGTGKTRFAIMFKNHLIKKFPPDGSQTRGSSSKYYAIYYDALGSDYYPDAMEPLMHAIVNSDALKHEGNADSLRNLKIICAGILKSLAYGAIRLMAGDAAVDAIVDTENTLMRTDEDPLDAYSKKLKMYDNFRDTLKTAIERTGKNLVIIIDELDRCKPTFAIQTIEMAKHLFDVKGLIFVFFLDITQLSSAAKCVYGNDMDATGYLCRYFDFISRLPTPDTLHFIDLKLRSIPYYRNMVVDYDETKNYIYELTQTFQLSLRDISTVLTNYAIMCSTVLKNYKRFQEHRIYLLLLVLKYKNLELYNMIISNNLLRDGHEAILTRQYELKRHKQEYQILVTIMDRIPIRDIPLSFGFADRNEKPDPVRILNVVSRKAYLDVTCVSNGARIDTAKKVKMNNCDDWGGMLFYHDLNNWEGIKNITLAEHFSRQLDHFQFTGLNALANQQTTEPPPVTKTPEAHTSKKSKQ
ncbi:MAG: P-loop NTPase fold protein [Clostridiaceae bacterium]